jgi:hypothetical protein
MIPNDDENEEDKEICENCKLIKEYKHVPKLKNFRELALYMGLDPDEYADENLTEGYVNSIMNNDRTWMMLPIDTQFGIYDLKKEIDRDSISIFNVSKLITILNLFQKIGICGVQMNLLPSKDPLIKDAAPLLIRPYMTYEENRDLESPKEELFRHTLKPIAILAPQVQDSRDIDEKN